MTRYVVIGGGIAGVCCAQEVARLNATDETVEVLLISAAELLKETAGVMKITSHLEEVSVFERSADRFCLDNPRIRIVHGQVSSIDTINKIVHIQSKGYETLCICSGAQPRIIASHPNVIGIRDLLSVADMTQRLSSARKVVIVGNGGIALELVHALTFCDVDWVVKDKFLGSAFFDASASAFIMPDLLSRLSNQKKEGDSKYATGGHDNLKHTPGLPAIKRHQGAALGPEWLAKSKLLDDVPIAVKESAGSLLIHFEQEIVDMKEGATGSWVKVGDTNSYLNAEDLRSMTVISTAACPDVHKEQEYPLYVRTSNNTIIPCDFLISATGVYPCSDFVGPEFIRGQSLASVAPLAASNPRDFTATNGSDLNHTGGDAAHKRDIMGRDSDDGALVVNEFMETSVKGVFAAGDCCLYQPTAVLGPGMSTEVSPISAKEYDIENAMAGKHWFQMRLWTQARSTGIYAAQCMCGQQDSWGGDFFFEIFAHVTRFFGYKVVLLGRYNAQGLGSRVESAVRTTVFTKEGLNIQSEEFCIMPDATTGTMEAHLKDTKKVEIWTRTTPGKEYVKVVIFGGKVVGALLMGDTGLEEVFENLILNRLDVSRLGVDLLDPTLDLEDYFD